MKFATTKEIIFYFIDKQGFSVKDFLNKTEIKRGFLDSDKLKATVSDIFITKIIAKYPELNILWLLTGEGNMLNEPQQEDIVEEDTQEYTTKINQSPKVVTIDKHGKDNIVLVPVKAAAGYLYGYDDPAFIEKLPTYNLPNLRNGIFRMFEVKGHSMVPTLHQGAFVVGQFVENWITDIKDDRVYIIVSKSEGIVVKRCLNRIEKYNSIFCKSDNRAEFPSYSLNPHDLKEVWEVKLALLSNLPNPADVFDRITDLESDVMYLKEKLNKQ